MHEILYSRVVTTSNDDVDDDDGDLRKYFIRNRAAWQETENLSFRARPPRVFAIPRR
jgi:hypothetical protein